jgi:hypothetical protein
MNKALVLMEVVAYLEAEIKSDREYLSSDEADSLSFEETFAIQNVISRFQLLTQHFQEQVDTEMSAYEKSQGM